MTTKALIEERNRLEAASVAAREGNRKAELARLELELTRVRLLDKIYAHSRSLRDRAGAVVTVIELYGVDAAGDARGFRGAARLAESSPLRSGSEDLAAAFAQLALLQDVLGGLDLLDEQFPGSGA